VTGPPASCGSSADRWLTMVFAGSDKHGYSSSRDYHVRPTTNTNGTTGKQAPTDPALQSSDHRRDSDRADRGDRDGRSGRGERSSRSERDRGERDRGDRDRRDRGDRERVDRGDRGDRGDRHRERSRSPGGHRSSRGSRRDFDHDSAARTERYREREPDRFPRHMDIDREYERERAGRDRDRERSSRYDDARRDSVGARKRSATPPVKKREPTPDLTDTIPISERKRRLTMWDIKPQGYENVTAEQAKLSGRILPFRYLLIIPLPAQALAYTSGGVSIFVPLGDLQPYKSCQEQRLTHYQLPVTRSHSRWYMEVSIHYKICLTY